MAEEQGGWPLERWVSVGTTIIAPATALSALLFYFGYVSSRTQYEYFGIDVDTIGLSTRDYVMRSPQPLLFPLLVLTLVAVGGLALHATVDRGITAATSGEGRQPLLERYDRTARWTLRAGWTLVGVGVALVVGYALVRDWAAYQLVTPLLLSVGSVLVGYASWMGRRLHPEDVPRQGSAVAQRRVAGVVLFLFIVVNLFWATATVAQWTGRGVARNDARHLDRLPSVILDTKEQLYLRDSSVEVSALPAAEGQTFHYRYRHLRLLIHGGDRMFLVPDQWAPGNTTLVVPLDGSVRVQFQFRNDPP
ncbi:MAG TPA: hypothetical protein PLP61_11655 [Nocardioides sp.]|uniref:hypothetical protein n=1 Tax=Nocardioides sp. TaxID=35761 RepID=UPI002C497DDB|nr:hypothetical protein [Nocardioides sp.]HQR27685.1 hypothetical protein [Nocardioides sp.]